MSKRNNQLDKLDKIYQEYYQERKDKFDDLTTKSNRKDKLELTHAANTKDYLNKLKAFLRGSHVRSEDIVNIVSKILPREFVQLVYKRDIKLLAIKAGISNNGSQSVIEKLWSEQDMESVLALEYTCFPEDVPSIQFLKENKEYAPLLELSVRRKCTALLIIALSEGMRPVIIDQPEDALDVTTIWKDISAKLRQYKEKRQFILTTHNPSVAVASYSDMFIVVKGSSSQANVKCWGAIEHPDVKESSYTAFGRRR